MKHGFTPPRCSRASRATITVTSQHVARAAHTDQPKPNNHLCSHEAHGSTTRPAPIETTELRWFRNGPLPRSVFSWFTSNGAFGAVEERHDRYLIDGRLDRGIKLRNGSTLELKVRQPTARTVPSSNGPDAVAELPRGTVEQWQKWSPADHLVSTGSAPWVEVHKRIVKRRFTIAGEEMTVLDHADTPVSAYCDIEIVVIDDGSAQGWSLAFAAHGPLPSRLAGIGAAWGALASVARPPSRSLVFDVSCGYPEWLERTVGPPPPHSRHDEAQPDDVASHDSTPQEVTSMRRLQSGS